ncbi:hypothetical protein ACFL32_00980 [Candidatus Neomarinimicrobiota bacterium]
MKYSFALITGLMLLGVLISCSENQIQDNEQAVQVQFDIWGSFAGSRIDVTINDQGLLNTTLTTQVPFAGPMLVVTTDLDVGIHHLTIKWRPVDTPSATYEESYTFETEDQVLNYYIGLSCDGSNLIVVVQSEPFAYL